MAKAKTEAKPKAEKKPKAAKPFSKAKKIEEPVVEEGTLRKADFIKRLKANHPENFSSMTAAVDIIDAIFDEVHKVFSETGYTVINLSQAGTFRKRHCPAKERRNPITGGKIMSQDYHQISFRPTFRWGRIGYDFEKKFGPAKPKKSKAPKAEEQKGE